MASYKEWCDLEEKFLKLHEQEPELYGYSFEFACQWMVRGDRGDGQVQFNSLARRAAMFAGHPNKEDALDWWLNHLKDYLLGHQSTNVNVVCGSGPKGKGEDFTINRVCESSANYCQEWANRAHKEEEKARNRKKPGKKADPKIKQRRKLVRKHMDGKSKSAFYHPEIFHALLSELDYDRIPPPIAQGKPIFVHRWVDVQDDEVLVDRVIEILNEDRWD